MNEKYDINKNMRKASELYFYSGKTYIIPYGAPFRLMLYSQSQEQLHYHDFCELVIVLSGNAMHITEEQDYPISAGDVFIIKKGETHMYIDTRKLKLANIMFDFDTLDINWGKLHDIPGYTELFEPELESHSQNHFRSKHTLNVAQLNESSILLQRMHREMEEKSPGWVMMSQTFLQELFIMLERSYSTIAKIESQKMVCLTRMIQFIEKNYAMDITRDRIMREGMTSNAVGTRIFKEQLGKSPIEYLIQTRIRHAAELLKITDKSISDIAHTCGFHDSNYFSLQFKKATGLTPRDFAKRYRAF